MKPDYETDHLAMALWAVAACIPTWDARRRWESLQDEVLRATFLHKARRVLSVQREADAREHYVRDRRASERLGMLDSDTSEMLQGTTLANDNGCPCVCVKGEK